MASRCYPGLPGSRLSGGGPPPAKRSLNGTSSPSKGSAGHAATGSSSSEHACARSAANEARTVHRRTNACLAPATHQGARWRALALPRTRRNVSVLRLMRPPSSTPNTTSLQRLAPWSSGYVRCFRSRAWARARPGSLSAPGRALPSRLTGLTILASTATWAPCQRGRPLATTSMRRPSAAGTSRFKSRRATFVATRAPASLQMLSSDNLANFFLALSAAGLGGKVCLYGGGFEAVEKTCSRMGIRCSALGRARLYDCQICSASATR